LKRSLCGGSKVTDIVYKDKMLMTDMEMQDFATAGAYGGMINKSFYRIIEWRDIAITLKTNDSQTAKEIKDKMYLYIEAEVKSLRYHNSLALEYIRKFDIEISKRLDKEGKVIG
jgi:hypothetical protein